MPITDGDMYIAKVTETPEPTLADVMAVLHEQARAINALAEATAASFGHVMTEISGVKADVADVADKVQEAETSLTVRVADVQKVVRTLKQDLARHLDDGGAHPHRHAA